MAKLLAHVRNGTLYAYVGDEETEVVLPDEFTLEKAGDGGGGGKKSGGEDEEDSDKKAAKRFAADHDLRRLYCVNTADAASEEYKTGLARYLTAERNFRADLNASSETAQQR